MALAVFRLTDEGPRSAFRPDYETGSGLSRSCPHPGEIGPLTETLDSSAYS